MHFTYVLRSEVDGRLYKGFTNNLERRLKEHEGGKNKSTAPYRPCKLVYFEQFAIREDAIKREKFFKTGEGREFIKNIIDPVA